MNIKSIKFKNGYGQWGKPEVIITDTNKEKYKVDIDKLKDFLEKTEWKVLIDKKINKRRKYSVLEPIIKRKEVEL